MLDRLRIWLEPMAALPEEYELRIQRLSIAGAVIACVHDGAGACLVCRCHRSSWVATQLAALAACQSVQSDEERLANTLHYLEHYLP